MVEALLRSRLWAQPAVAEPPAPPSPDEWIAEPSVIKRFGLDANWLRRHRAALRARRIISGSRKQRVYHLRRMGAFLDAQASR